MPPCIIGAVIMKITSNSNITSIKLTTLISAFSSRRCRRRRNAISDHALAHEQRDERSAEALHLAVELIQPIGEDVVPERRRNSDGERGGRRDERFGYTRCDRGKIA